MALIRCARVAWLLVVPCAAVTAAAQSARPLPLDRVVAARTMTLGPGQFMFESLFAALRAVSVPVGFEAIDAFTEDRVETKHWPGPFRELRVAGLTVRELLDAVAAAGVELDRVTGHQLVGAVNLATGHRAQNGGPATTRTLSMTFDGGQLIDLLNALVETHGEMGWSLHSSPTPSEDRRTLTMTPKLFLHSPVGMAINGALLEPEQPVPTIVRIKGTPLATSGSSTDATSSMCRCRKAWGSCMPAV